MFNDNEDGVLWLEQDSERSGSGLMDPAARQYIYIESENFELVYKKLREMVPDVSDIVNSQFHLFDPNGNRLSFYNY